MPENSTDEPPLLRCNYCGDDHDESELEEVVLFRWDDYRDRLRTQSMNLCDGCREDVEDCCRCGRTVLNDDSPAMEEHESLGDWPACRNCLDMHALTCSQCMAFHWEDESERDFRGAAFCSDCAIGFLYCEECDNAFPNEVMYNEPRYHRCIPSLRRLIWNYSYKPDPKFRPGLVVRYREPQWIEPRDGDLIVPKKLRTPLYMGVELEVDVPEEDGDIPDPREAYEMFDQFIKQSKGLIYLKQDGSLANGVEIVTHPMTWEWARDRFPYQFLDHVRDVGYGGMEDGVNTAGLHVHVSRDAFDRGHMWRFIKFQVRNKQQCMEVARRGNVQYSNWAYVDEADRVARIAKHLNKPRETCPQGGHSAAINFGNRETVELRYFASTTRADILKATMGYVDSIYQFTKDLPTLDCKANGRLDWEKYSEWVQDHQDLYPDLLEYLSSRSLV